MQVISICHVYAAAADCRTCWFGCCVLLGLDHLQSKEAAPAVSELLLTYDSSTQHHVCERRVHH